MGRKAIDLTGQQFGRLTVIKRVANSADGHARWLCQCSCEEHNLIEVSSNVLKKGNTKSCGCLNREVASLKAKNNYKNLEGQKFNRLTAKEFLGSNGKGSALWRCECDCGNTNFITTSHHLISGNTQSCGCLKSIGESNIAKILTQNNIKFEQQKKFSDAIYEETKGAMRFDFYLPEHNRLIEFDGIQHFKSLGGWNDEENLTLVIKRDQIKNEYALSHNIPLIRIPYWERDNITLEMIMGDQYIVPKPAQPTV